MKYCSACGERLQLRIPKGDNRERHCCPSCDTIHYINPKIIVGTIPCFEDKILLCKRAIEPRLGFWTLPAGFMEINETTHQGALRETWEEAHAKVELGPLFSMFDVVHAEQVHLFYRATLHTAEYSAGEESLDVRLFSEHNIPWDELAFTSVSKTLRLFFNDKQTGRYTLHTGDVSAPSSWLNEHFNA
jgi:ADP-ribose pyrophosphatase YjhB (NUDIX family)